MNETTITRKVGRNRGKTRIWLEGAALKAMGWLPGTTFNVSFEKGKITYTRGEMAAQRKVASKGDNPIIDTNTDKIKESVGDEQVKVTITATAITIVAASIMLAMSLFFDVLPVKAPSVLVACEYSGLVRDAMREAGADAISCDLLATERPGDHVQGDVLALLGRGWDIMIGHPPCTGLALSGARWQTHHFVKKKTHPDGGYWHDPTEKIKQREEGLAFFRKLWEAPIGKIALEQPMSMATRVCKKSQTIHPWQFGHTTKKQTWLWLKNLSQLTPTQIIPEELRTDEIHMAAPGPNRWKERSRTFTGIARAMATQWL